jgi:hypothetical protein
MRHSMFGVLIAGALMVMAGRAAAFDARSPVDVLSVINADGASGQLKTTDKGAPWIDAKAGKLGFEVDFIHCDATNTRCGTLLYAMGFNMTSITLDQINGWNRWAVLCPAYLTSETHPRVWYALKPSPDDTPDDVKAQVDAWLSCMSDFDKFTDAPDAFLKALQ